MCVGVTSSTPVQPSTTRSHPLGKHGHMRTLCHVVHNYSSVDSILQCLVMSKKLSGIIETGFLWGHMAQSESSYS